MRPVRILLAALIALIGCKKSEPTPADRDVFEIKLRTATPAAQPRPKPSPPQQPAEPTLRAPVEIGLPRKVSPAAAPEFARTAWQGLEKAKNGCEPYDIAVGDFPGGGLRTLACHLLSFVPFPFLSALSGGPVYADQNHLG